MKDKDIIEHNIFISKKIFLDDIKSSFKSKKSIFKQFKVDLPRCDIFINNHKIVDSEYFKYYLDNKFNEQKVYNILMLSTQASLGLPFTVIGNNLNNNYYLVNSSKNKEKYIK